MMPQDEVVGSEHPRRGVQMTKDMGVQGMVWSTLGDKKEISPKEQAGAHLSSHCWSLNLGVNLGTQSCGQTSWCAVLVGRPGQGLGGGSHEEGRGRGLVKSQLGDRGDFTPFA